MNILNVIEFHKLPLVLDSVHTTVSYVGYGIYRILHNFWLLSRLARLRRP